MVANDHPGCCGVAAKLPKKPGTQKLTPPSSADAFVAALKQPIAIADVATAKDRRRALADIEAPRNDDRNNADATRRLVRKGDAPNGAA
jgi:hypothetical protein